MCRLECVDICIYIYIYGYPYPPLNSHFVLCVKSLCLGWSGNIFYSFFEMERFWSSKGKEKVVTFSMYFETLKDVQRLVNCSHCWGEESWEGHCKSIYIKEGAGILLFQLPWQESFQSKPSFVVFCSTKLNFSKEAPVV